MEEYKIRFIKEYLELKHRIFKLENLLRKFDLGILEFEPKCPIEILKAQFYTMQQYLTLLEIRAQIEHIDLDKENL